MGVSSSSDPLLRPGAAAAAASTRWIRPGSRRKTRKTRAGKERKTESKTIGVARHQSDARAKTPPRTGFLRKRGTAPILPAFSYGTRVLQTHTENRCKYLATRAGESRFLGNAAEGLAASTGLPAGSRSGRAAPRRRALRDTAARTPGRTCRSARRAFHHARRAPLDMFAACAPTCGHGARRPAGLSGRGNGLNGRAFRPARLLSGLRVRFFDIRAHPATGRIMSDGASTGH